MKINVLFGVLILAAIVAIFIPNVEIGPQMSPSATESNIKLSTQTGVLHSECAKACLIRGCTTSESYKEDLFVCKCTSCPNEDITLTSENRIFE
jgi:hypothetical protein